MDNEIKSVLTPASTAVETADNKASVADATNVAPVATPKETGHSIVVGFRYIGKWAHVELKNGVKGIVGSAEQFPFGSLLTLKGSGMECRYERLSDKTTATGTYKRYSLTWSVE